MNINNKLKVPLLNLFNNEYSYDIGLNPINKNNNNIDIKEQQQGVLIIQIEVLIQ